jgi:hypothetical protein
VANFTLNVFSHQVRNPLVADVAGEVTLMVRCLLPFPLGYGTGRFFADAPDFIHGFRGFQPGTWFLRTGELGMA